MTKSGHPPTKADEVGQRVPSSSPNMPAKAKQSTPKESPIKPESGKKPSK